MPVVRAAWRPYQVVTLLELLVIEADAFCRLSSMLGQMVMSLAGDRVPPPDVVGANLGELQREVERLNLRSPRRQLERMKEHFTSGQATARSMHPMVLDLYMRLLDDLDDKHFLMIPAELNRYYTQEIPLFGKEVTEKFPSLSFEIDEAGKCFALNRNTACVFHLMRVMELSIRAVTRCLQMPDAKPADRSWGVVLKGIRQGIEARWPTVAERDSGDGAFFDALYASLDAVKNPWRNGTMHPANKYTDDEAEHVFVAVRAFMTKLASRCDEHGDPKA